MDKDRTFLERLRVAEKVRKLLALANKHPDTPEGRSAREKAGLLMAKHNIDPASLNPRQVSRSPDAFESFARNFRGFSGRDDEDYTKYDEDGNRKK